MARNSLNTSRLSNSWDIFISGNRKGMRTYSIARKWHKKKSKAKFRMKLRYLEWSLFKAIFLACLQALPNYPHFFVIFVLFNKYANAYGAHQIANNPWKLLTGVKKKKIRRVNTMGFGSVEIQFNANTSWTTVFLSSIVFLLSFFLFFFSKAVNHQHWRPLHAKQKKLLLASNFACAKQNFFQVDLFAKHDPTLWLCISSLCELFTKVSS